MQIPPYDFENRLIRRTSSSTTINVLYDCDGNRVSETVTASGGSTSTVTFLVDTLNPTGYAQVVEERVNGVLSRTYAHGHALLSQTQTTLGGWTTSYFSADGHGSIRQLTDALGTVTDTYAYDAFGIQIASTSTAAQPTFNRYRYVGEQYDEDLGLIYLRARYMNPSSGRFWSTDSFEGVKSDPLSLHRYLYANANPVSGSDPSGHITLGEVMVAVSIGTLINNIATPVIAAYLSAESAANLNDQSANVGFVVSLRGSFSARGIIGEAGVDVLWLPKQGANGFYVFFGGDLGTNPISFWNKHKGPGGSASVGIVWGIDNAGDWGGTSVTATWPIGALIVARPVFRALGPTVNSGVMSMIEKIAYFNNRKRLYGVAQIGFSGSGPGFFRWGFSSNAFTWEAGYMSKPLNVGDVSGLFSGLSVSSVMDDPTILQERAAALSP